MPDTVQTDLSKLQIRRVDSPGEKRRSRSPFLMGGGMLLVFAVLFILYKTFATPAVEVETTTVTTLSASEGSSLLTASGYVVAQRKAAVASKATGRLVYLGYVEGDHVKKGEVIARIESGDVEAALAQARANVDVNIADQADASHSLERAKELIARKLISQADLDAAQGRFDRVTASIASAKATVQEAEVAVENTLIRAPFDGTILTKNADVGEVVSPLSAGASSRVAVVTLADMSSLQVEADVSESNIEKVRINQPCTITLDAYAERSYRGSVAKIVPTADRAKATVLTKIRFDEIDGRVLPEMGAKVRFLEKKQPDAGQQSPKTVIPISAVATRDGRKVAYAVGNNTVREILVGTGEVNGSMVEITSGLSPGETIVNKPPDNLQGGAKIKIKE